jgi:hypothetical protein
MLPEAHGRKVDYGLLQEESKRVVNRGEEFVFNFEKVTLERAGRADLAGVVRWVASEFGDGAGYDIRSFSLDGRLRYIEVKATKLGALTPFYITSAELDFARRHQSEYAIYRVFDVGGDAPEFYVLEGGPRHSAGCGACHLPRTSCVKGHRRPVRRRAQGHASGRPWRWVLPFEAV